MVPAPRLSSSGPVVGHAAIHLRNLFLIALLVLAPHAWGQDLDSLRTTANDQSLPDSTRAQAMGDLARSYAVQGQEDSAFLVARRLLSFCKERKLTQRLPLAQAMLGKLYGMTGSYDSSRVHLQPVLEHYRRTGDKAQEGETELSIGLSFHLQGLRPQAMSHNLRALALIEASKDSAALAHAHVNIAALYGDMGRVDEAIAHVEKATVIMRATGDPRIRNALGQLGALVARKGELQTALSYMEEALALSEQMGDMATASRTLQSMGGAYHGLKQYDKALASYERSSALTRSSYTTVQNKLNIGLILIEMGQARKAIPLLHEAANDAHADGAMPDESKAHEGLAMAYENVGETQKAYAEYREHIALRDSITNEANTREFTQHEMQYEFDKVQLADSLRHEGAIAIQVKEIQKQKVIRNGFVGGFALVALFAAVFFFQRNRIAKEKQRSEELLLNILPAEVAEELKAKGEADAVQIDQVTVLFTDFKGFTALSETLSPKELVRDLNECFSGFDKITSKYGIEKIKTIGDAYMAAGGLPTPNATHATDVINAAIEMRDFIAEGKARKVAAGLPYFEVRIGVHTGPVVAGIVGVKKFQYDIWGDTVNTASRMESSGEAGKVNISAATYELVRFDVSLAFTQRGKIQAKGKGEMDMFFVTHA